jgi:hypothetical protein
MGVLLILAAILFPTLASAKNESFKTSCASNLKQLFLASSLYSADADQLVPYAIEECNARGLCISKEDPQFWAKVQAEHIPPFSKALRPYGITSGMFRIPVGLGPEDFIVLGGNYFYANVLSARPLMPYEQMSCPFFVAHRTYFQNGGADGIDVNLERDLTLFFDGRVSHSLLIDIFRNSEDCQTYTITGKTP